MAVAVLLDLLGPLVKKVIPLHPFNSLYHVIYHGVLNEMRRRSFSASAFGRKLNLLAESRKLWQKAENFWQKADF